MVILEGKNLTKYFGALAAIQSVDFVVESGEILGMIGPNGAGKSTLFNVIAGVYKPDRGEVIFKGSVTSGLKPYRICRRGVAKTSQIPQPFTQMTVLENVLVAGLYGKGLSLLNATQEAERILEFIGLGGLKGMSSGSITVSGSKEVGAGKSARYGS